MCAYIEGAVVMPSTVMDGTNVDAEVFKILFTSLNDLLQKESVENIDDDEAPAYKTSPAQKKEKFKKHWPVLEQVYKDSLGLKADGSESGRLIAYHKYVEEAFSQDLSEDDKEVIQSYLKTKSILILHENNDDPIKSIHQMASTMSKELDLGFIPSSHVLSFVLNMFFKCDVFPLLMETP